MQRRVYNGPRANLADAVDCSNDREFLMDDGYGADVPDGVYELQEDDIDEFGCVTYAGNMPRFVYPICKLCQDRGKRIERHFLHRCEFFGKMTIGERKTFLRGENRCFNCLAPGHSSGDCRRTGRCSKCKERHHTMICTSNREPMPRRPT